MGEIVRMLTAFTVLLLILPESRAFAYLDPGSGSMILQAILAGIAAVGVSMSLFWRKIRSLFRGKSPKEERSDGD